MKQRFHENTTLGKFEDGSNIDKLGWNYFTGYSEGFSSLYSSFPYIPSLHLYVSEDSIGYLSHQNLLEVVEAIASCEVTVQGLFPHNAAS